MQLKLIYTEDGSTTVHHPALNETFHSIHGAVQESMHVFIRNGLFSVNPGSQINLFEVGLGTGLNALLTAIESEERNLKVNYLALEPFPIKYELYSNLNFSKILDDFRSQKYLEKIHTAPFNKQLRINDSFEIIKLKEKLEEFEFPRNQFNIVYFDAFSPEVQPELWELEIYRKIFKSMKDMGVLVTYCAKGKVRRELEQAGFKTERLPGPIGKREMLRATKTF